MRGTWRAGRKGFCRGGKASNGSAMSGGMTYREHGRAALKLGLPLVGSHLAQMAITLTDDSDTVSALLWYSGRQQ